MPAAGRLRRTDAFRPLTVRQLTTLPGGRCRVSGPKGGPEAGLGLLVDDDGRGALQEVV